MPPSRRPSHATTLFRLAGAAVMVLTLLPLYRYLDHPATGAFGASTLRATEAQVQFLWRASLVLVCGVALATLVFSDERLGRWVRGAGRILTASSQRIFSAAVGAIAAGAVALQHLLVFQGRPNLMDAAAQLIHARYLARGRLAGPGAHVLEGGFWYFPNTVASPNGWVSHFPPGHSLVLAPGLAVGAAWLGPVVVAGLTGWLTARLAFRLLPERPLVARGGALLGALSPLLILQTASFMNHGTAALLGVATVLAALRAREEGWPWAAATGAGVTGLLLVRPLGAVAVCAVVVLLVWLPRETPGLRRMAGWCGAAVLAGLPLLLLHGWYNAYFFGHPLTFGYHSTFGEAAGLGLGLDPWGNRFGPRESLAYTSADLSSLNRNLVEFPLPAITLVGLALLLGMGREWRVRVLAGWALLPVALSAFYWHHGNFMGPRMLAEFAPTWGLLVAAALAYLVERLPRRDGRGLVVNPRRAGQLLVLGAAMGALVLGPHRMSGMGGDLSAGYRLAEPAAPPGAVSSSPDPGAGASPPSSSPTASLREWPKPPSGRTPPAPWRPIDRAFAREKGHWRHTGTGTAGASGRSLRRRLRPRPPPGSPPWTWSGDRPPTRVFRKARWVRGPGSGTSRRRSSRTRVSGRSGPTSGEGSSTRATSTGWEGYRRSKEAGRSTCGRWVRS